MRARRLLLASLGLLVASAALPAAAEEQGATLSLVNPELVLNGLKIKRITVTLDGAEFGSCDTERRLPGNVCVKRQTIPAGPHVIEILFDPLTSQYFRSSDKFTAGVSGDWTMDLKGMAVDNAQTADYLKVSQRLAAVEGCRPAVERVAALPSCTFDELGVLAPAFAEAAKACSGDLPKKERRATIEALSEIVDNHFHLGMERCFDSSELKKLPERIKSFVAPDSDWPLDNGSWRWARGEEPDLTATSDIGEALDKLQQPLPEMAKRFAVLDGVIKVYLGGDPQAVLKDAINAPWSLDPETPEGHRNLLLLGDPGRFRDDAYADFVATKATEDKDLDCKRTDWEARLIIGYLSEGDRLSAAAVRTMLAMASRVPADAGFGDCARVADLTVESDVAPIERLRGYFAVDCGQRRDPAHRGEALRSFVERPDDRAVRPLLNLIRQEFASCLAATQQNERTSMTTERLNEAKAQGCKIEPEAKCSRIQLSKADLHGADLHGAKLDGANLEEADLHGANLQLADLSGTILDKADLVGVDLKGARLAGIYARKTDLHGLNLAGVASLSKVNLNDSDLHGSDLGGVSLAGSLLYGVNFAGASLAGADLSEAKLDKANFQGADLRHAKFDGATLQGVDFSGAKLDGASLGEVRLKGANFQGAELGSADLTKAPLEEVTWITGCKLVDHGSCPGADLHGRSFRNLDLSGIDLSGANLRNADLSSAFLQGADLHGADLRGANVAQVNLRDANLAGANLEGAAGGIGDDAGANMSEAIDQQGHKCKAGDKADRYHSC